MGNNIVIPKIEKMATDIEELDTDDHEKPAPSKRQCTRLKGNETTSDMDKVSNEKEEMGNVDYDDTETLAREKLKRWQACQVAKGYVDNAVNKVLENRRTERSSTENLGEYRFPLFRENDTEDTAVIMAIRDHGLVQSAGLVSQSNAFYGDKAPGYWTNSEYMDVHRFCPSNRIHVANFENSMATTSTDSLGLNQPKDTEECNWLDRDLDKIDENDQQENILERAVAEAIKKKGLGAPSVDDG